MKIEYRPADEKFAREFLAWQYEPPYDVYNCPPIKLEDSVFYNSDPANNVYAMFDQNNNLVSYCSYGRDAQVSGGDYSQAALDIGLMVKPELTCQGLGASFAADVIRNGIEKYAPQRLRVTIAAFNTRARRVWEKHRFKQTQAFKRSGDGMEFTIMLKKLTDERAAHLARLLAARNRRLAK
jgi:RimJ/RimL family protein N-acetyltransferase